ncbi:DENN domain-containing protein 10-like [Diadema setosum]|uniref:DENN domain-containing protein 10-like n=1 Tax=Diadema setosum TaxID=31175 RepID=UPI003B3A6968
MAALISLSAAGLIEKDRNGDVLWTWSYPAVSSAQRKLLTRKCCLSQENGIVVPFVYGQFRREWFYIATVPVENGTVLKKVKHFSLILLAKDFNPEKYQTLGKILCRIYASTGNAAVILQSYLAVVTKGMCPSEDNGTFVVQDFEAKKAYAAGSVKDVINMFGLQAILIYTALVLKKKVVVFHSRVEEVIKFTRALPSFVWHRQNWSIVHPFVHLEEEELEDLRSGPAYVAGFVDAAVESKTDLYDVFVNLSTEEITVGTHAKETFAMSRLHKDIAQLMVKCAADDDLSNQQVIKEISKKTTELLNNLKSLAGDEDDPKITLEMLQERKMPPATERFLFGVATAEGLVQM